MKRMLWAVIAMLAIFTVASGTAFADRLTATGAPVITGSWSQEWNEIGLDCDKIEFFLLTPGVSFEAPGLYGFTDAGWTGSIVNPSYALGTGNLVNDLTFFTKFGSDQATPLSFDFFAWDGGTIVDTGHGDWSGTEWSLTSNVNDPTGTNYNRAAGEPLTLFLLGALGGLTGLGKGVAAFFKRLA